MNDSDRLFSVSEIQAFTGVANDYVDGILSPDESVVVPFPVCLQNFNPFRFFVDVSGIVNDVPSTQGLVAYYPFNGNANDGTVHGATLTEDRFGNANSAYSFDGVDDYISIPFSSDFDFSQEKQISYGVWIHVNSLEHHDNVPLGQDAPCSHFAYAIDIYGDNHSQARHVEAAIHTTGCWLLSVSPGTLTLNNWHQIFVTADENNLRLYINGEKG